MKATNLFVTATRHRAAALFASLALLVSQSALHAQNGDWTNNVAGNASGSWATAANWNNSIIADGADNTADFSTLDITDLSTVTLDGARSIGNLIFGDTTPSTNWVLNTGSAGPLSLAVSSGSPTITVNNQLTTVGAVVASASGLSKAGAGTLRLNASNPNLSNIVEVVAGVLQAGNGGAFGPTGNHEGTDRVLNTNGGTVQVILGQHVNNKHLTMSGDGAGGLGALYFDLTGVTGNNSGTRWGLNAWNGSSSPNSSATYPAISLAADATLRVDGPDWRDQPGVQVIPGHISGTVGTTPEFKKLTKTGGGRASFDRGVSGLHTIEVQGGSILPNQASAFGSVQLWHIASGASVIVNQNNCSSGSAMMQIDAGGLWDLNWRGNGTAGSDNNAYSQSIGYLAGSGIITAGSRGQQAVQTFNINGADSNSVFNGIITVSNNLVRLNVNKNGANKLTLNGDTSYKGVTTINAGELELNGNHTGLGGYLVNAGILSGAGTIFESITNITGTIQPTAGATLTVRSNIIGSFGDTISISNANLAVDGFVGPDFYTVGFLNMTNGMLEVPLRTTGASVFVSALNVDGNAVIKYSMATPLVGHFPILSYTSIGGLAGFSGLSLVNPPGITATLSNNTANSTIDVVITAVPALTWEGAPGGVWSVGGGNWKSGATYTEPGGSGPFVIFDDTAAGITSVTLDSTLAPQGVTVNNSSLNYTFSGSGSLAGSAGLAKQGSGSLTVANSGNSFSGGVSIQAGTLQLGTGGTSGDLGSGAIVNQGTLALNRSDSFSLANTVSGNGSITKAGAGTATVPISGDSSGAITVNAGTLLVGPVATSKLSGDITGPGGFGVSGAGTVVLSGFNNTYSGGTVISSGTLQFGDEFGAGLLPPAGNLPNNGTLATTLTGTLANNISGTGGVTILSNAFVTLSGINTYSGPTRVVGAPAWLTADAANYPAASMLVLGNTNGGPEIGSVSFNSGNPVLGGLVAGGNSATPGNPISLLGSAQRLTVNGNLIAGNVGPAGASVYLPVTGTGASLAVVTNGGIIQIGLGAAGSGVNPDNVFVDLSLLDGFTADLGAAGVINLGTLDGNPGPPAGATVVNWFKLAAVSNHITAGSLNVGAGGRQLIPELFLGGGTNVLNVSSLVCGSGGRDGSYVHFEGASGGLKLRGSDGVSAAAFAVGNNPATGTGANITNTVDFTGHPVDLLVSTLTIGNYNNAGIYENTVSMDQGILNAQSTSLSLLRNNNANAAFSGSTLNLGGGIASLGPVNLTASAAYGTLNITGGASVTVQSIASPGAGVATLDVNASTLTIDLQGFGNPASAPVQVDTFNAAGTVNIRVNGTGWTVGTFTLIDYSGAIGGVGYGALNLTSLPAGVTATLVDNVANSSVDLNITAAPPAINPNPGTILSTLAGSTLTLSWPTNSGWILQSQTNPLNVGLSSNWVDMPGSASVTSMNLTIDPANPTVHYRLRHP